MQTHPERDGTDGPQRHGSLAVPLDRETAEHIAHDLTKGLESPETQSILIYLEGDDPNVTEWMGKLDHLLAAKGHDFLSPVEVDEVGPPPMPTSMYIGPIATVAIGLSAEEVSKQFHDVIEEERNSAREAWQQTLDSVPYNQEASEEGDLPLEGQERLPGT